MTTNNNGSNGNGGKGGRSREELLGRMEQTAGTTRRTPKVQIGRTQNKGNAARRSAPTNGKFTADQLLHFDIYGEDHPEVLQGKQKADDYLVQQLKREINTAGISRKDLYAFIGDGEGMLFKNANQAYNLEYGLRGRATITMECARRWLTIIGKEVITVFQTADDGWFDSLLALREAVLRGETDPSVLRELAEKSVGDDNSY